MIKIYEALSFAANCRAAENTLLGPGAWNADMWYNSNCERTFLLKHSQEQHRILWSPFLLIHLKTAGTQITMVIVTHLGSAIKATHYINCVVTSCNEQCVLSSSVRRQGKEQGDSMQSSLNSQRPTQHFYLQTYPSSGWIIHTCSPFTARWRKIASIFIYFFLLFLLTPFCAFQLN